MYVIGKVDLVTGVTTYIELSEDEFLRFQSFYKKYKEFEKITLTKNIAKNSILDFKNFLSNQVNYMNNGQDITVEEINIKGTDLILKFILLNRMYLENLKEYIFREFGVNSSQYNEYKKRLKTTDFDFIFLRLIRNYTQHFGLPLSNVGKMYDALRKIYIEPRFLITKTDLLKANFNNNEINLLKEHLEDKIIINNYIDIWIDIITEATKLSEEIFVADITESFYDFFNKYDYILSNANVIHHHDDGTYNQYKINKEIYNVIQKYIDKEIIKELHLNKI